ncbi:DUF4377 domain-containing protein, partial [Bordetella pertussis]|uniref:DUF4377 domain-containing protein n=1 Tax=Bordetella pertussis TaxID=520 RepID=UPI0021CBC0DF
PPRRRAAAGSAWRRRQDGADHAVVHAPAHPLAGGQPGAAKLVYVASSKAPCSAGAGRAQCYQVRDSASQPWLLWYGDITGFAFQPGIEYRLRVVEVRDPNPPADASGVRWVLDSVVEQRVAAPRPAPAP